MLELWKAHHAFWVCLFLVFETSSIFDAGLHIQ